MPSYICDPMGNNIPDPLPEDFFDNLQCADSFHKYPEENRQECIDLCPLPCKEVIFDTTITSSMWPSVGAEKKLVEELGWVEDEGDSVTWLRNNVLELKVFYEDLAEKKIETLPKYDSWAGLVCIIGGHLGLCLGFSLVTGLEVVVFLVDLWCSAVCRCQRAKVGVVRRRM